MKLIYITNSRIPTEKAHGIQTMKMCEAFAEFSNVELVLPKRFNWIKEEPFSYYGMNKSFKTIKLPCLDLIRFHRHLGHFGLWLENLTFLLSSVFYLFLRKADVIYTRDRPLLPVVFLKKNIIIEAHSFPGNYFLYSYFFKKIKAIVVITEKLKAQFMGRGIAEDKILIASDGVDLEDFDIRNSQQVCRKKLSLPYDKKIILYTGHLYKWKGAQILAEASQFLPGNAEVYFVGGTKEDIEKFKIKNSQFKINIAGHRPYSEIPFWLKAADVLILPNSGKEEISRKWTSPMKLFEYMASKRPIVASDLPAIREILNERNSVLVESNNPAKLAQGIKEVLQNPQLSDKISAKAFEDVKEFTWKKRAEKILNFFHGKS